MKLDIIKYLDLLKESFDSSEINIFKNDADTIIIRICIFTDRKLLNNQFALSKKLLDSIDIIDIIDFYFDKAIEEIKQELNKKE